MGAIRRLPDAERRTAATAVTLALEIPVCQPFNVAGLIAYLGARAMPGVEELGSLSYTRAVTVAEAPGVLAIDFARVPEGRLAATCDVATSEEQIADLVERVARPSLDVRAIEAHLARDERLRSLIARQGGLRIPGTTDPLELTVRAILGQQVSVARASDLSARLAARFGSPLPRPLRSITRTFPSAEALANAPIEEFGVPRIRAAAIRTVASMAFDGRLVLRRGGSIQEIVAELLSIRGIGPWTASYVALRALGDSDAIATGDLGLRQAVGSRGDPASAADLAQIADHWRPWRGYAAAHLWTSLLTK